MCYVQSGSQPQPLPCSSCQIERVSPLSHAQPSVPLQHSPKAPPHCICKEWAQHMMMKTVRIDCPGLNPARAELNYLSTSTITSTATPDTPAHLCLWQVAAKVG